MGRRSAVEDRAGLAIDDMVRLSRASRRIVGLLDAAVIATRTARALGAITATDATAMAIREEPELLVMRGAWRVRTAEVRGLRVRAGDGAGGRVLRSGRPVAVADLGTEPEVSEDLIDRVVRGEGVHAIVCVPLRFREQVIGVLYSVNRSAGHLGDRVAAVTRELAATAGPALGAALHAERAQRLGVEAERQRISRDLHDHVAPLLFGIGAAAHRARAGLDPAAEDLAAQLELVEAQASRAASSLREALHALAPARAGDGLAAAIGVDVGCFSDCTGLPADLAVIGPPVALSAQQEAALLAVVREGLHNAARHAGATSVLVTLHHGPEGTDVLVQDDGCGLPDDIVPCDLPRDGRHYGIASLRRRLERVGGELDLVRNQDGGTTLRGTIPRHDDDIDSRSLRG
ncbi:MAG TPA: histidine kinase [Candidatus Dormibacteraeota bacterium]